MSERGVCVPRFTTSGPDRQKQLVHVASAPTLRHRAAPSLLHRSAPSLPQNQRMRQAPRPPKPALVLTGSHHVEPPERLPYGLFPPPPSSMWAEMAHVGEWKKTTKGHRFKGHDPQPKHPYNEKLGTEEEKRHQIRTAALKALVNLESVAKRALYSAVAWIPQRLRQLTALDGRLHSALLDSTLRLLRTDWLLKQPQHWRIQSRQELELREAADGELPFLSPFEASCWLQCCGRHIGALSYASLSAVGCPDPYGASLATVRAYLVQSPSIVGLYWDWASTYAEPLTPGEERIARAAAQVKVDVFGSAIGTVSLLLKEIPMRPAQAEGVVIVGGFDAASLAEPRLLKQVRTVLMKYDKTVLVEIAHHRGCLSARFSTDVAALQAVQKAPCELKALASQPWLALEYDQRPYERRGFAVLEALVSQMAVSKLGQVPEMARLLQRHNRPKVVLLAKKPECYSRLATEISILIDTIRCDEATIDEMMRSAALADDESENTLSEFQAFSNRVGSVLAALGVA